MEILDIVVADAARARSRDNHDKKEGSDPPEPSFTHALPRSARDL
jgi:hypothetical protein